MIEVIFSLLGVLLGGIISIFSTRWMENRRKKEENNKKKLEVLSKVILHYSIFEEKIRKISYFQESPREVVNFYYDNFSEMRLKNYVNELVFLPNEMREYVEKCDSKIWEKIYELEEGEMGSSSNLGNELGKYIKELCLLVHKN